MLTLTDLTPTPRHQEAIYNSLDNMQTAALKEIFDGGLLPDWAQPTLRYSELMLGPIMTMMRRGVKIDLKTRDKIVTLIQERHDKVLATFDELCNEVFGTDININSPPQLKLLFYSFLAIPEQTKSKRGDTKVGTDKDILDRICKEYPRGRVFAAMVLRLRDLKGQIKDLSRKLTPNNRFLSSYNIAGTETFRLSSSEHPLRMGGNGQNVPAIARPCYVADDGYLFFQADQQGAESRLVAYRSGDENYIRAVEDGDAHTMVASMVFGFDADRELAEKEYLRGKSFRQFAKVGGHLTNYMGQPFTMATSLGIGSADAERFQALYFKRFPGIADFHTFTANQLRTKGYIDNPFGMRRTFWGRKWDDATLREAIAFYPQSAVGVLTNLCLYRLWLEYEGKPGAPVQILMNGHDAVIGQFRKDQAKTLVPEILSLLKLPFVVEDIHGVKRTVTIPFDMEVGSNWGKASVSNPEGLKKWKSS